MITVLIHTDTRYPVNRKKIRKAVEDTFKKHKVENSDLEVSVAVVGSRKMKELSQKYLDDISNHQILTFVLTESVRKEQLQQTERLGFVDSPDGILRLGDVVLCWPQVLEDASYDDIMVDDEVYALICHGVGYLLGYSHDV